MILHEWRLEAAENLVMPKIVANQNMYLMTRVFTYLEVKWPSKKWPS